MKPLDFCFLKRELFSLIYKNGKSKFWKRRYWQKILKEYAKEPIFEGKEWSFRIRKKIIELKDRELKDSEVKIKIEIEELFFTSNILSTDEMEKFEQNEMKKIRPGTIGS